MADVTPALIEQLSSVIAAALRQSTTESAPPTQPRPPQFSMQPYRSADGTTIADYFMRFTWALNLRISMHTTHVSTWGQNSMMP